jgi:hypothetical protein
MTAKSEGSPKTHPEFDSYLARIFSKKKKGEEFLMVTPAFVLVVDSLVPSTSFRLTVNLLRRCVITRPLQ